MSPGVLRAVKAGAEAWDGKLWFSFRASVSTCVLVLLTSDGALGAQSRNALSWPSRYTSWRCRYSNCGAAALWRAPPMQHYGCLC